MSSTNAYSRDVVVDCVTRHYDTLIHMGQIESSDVLHPPPGGWSDEKLHVEGMRAMRRTDAVVDLLRHIPYLTKRAQFSAVHLYYETYPRSYLRDALRGYTMDEFSGANTPPRLCPFEGALPPAMISLSNGDAVGPWWLVDTEHGLLYPWGDARIMRDIEDYPGKPWRAVKPSPIQEYFDKIHAEIVTLKMVPCIAVGSWGSRMMSRKHPKGKAMADLYRQHGWPDKFRRDEFMRAREAEAEWESD